VSERTLRRDIERLRDLGYTVESDRGVDGGYRLGASTGPALLIDDDEAVVLAVALHVTAASSAEFADAALGALTKVCTMLTPEQRRRAETVGANTVFPPSANEPSPDLSILDVVAAACRDGVRISFAYVAANGDATNRYVEPCQLVTLNARWYLVAYDTDRSAWRTFRIDRMTEPVPSRNTFEPRPPPATDLYEFVRLNMSEPNAHHQVLIEIDLPANDVRSKYGTWADIQPLDKHRCRLTMTTDSFQWPTHILANLDAPSTVVGPAEFCDHLLSVAAHLEAAVNR
jgi:predicted DNA-binding transcriptional regulator YafY